MPGRIQKTVEQKLLEGTHRPDRDVDPAALGLITRPLTAVECPKTIRDKKTREAWGIAIRPLCLTGRISEEDVPLLELAHLALQDVYLYQKRLARLQRQKGYEDDPDDLDLIAKMTRLVSRRSEDYRKIMCLFGVTPIERMRILSGAGRAGKSRKTLTDRLLE